MKFYYATDSSENAVVAMIGGGMNLQKLTGLNEKKAFVHDLLTKGCPLGNDFSNSDCPLRQARKLTDCQRELFVESLSEEQVDEIFTIHENCCCFFSYYLTERNDQLVGVSYRKPLNHKPDQMVASAEIVELR